MKLPRLLLLLACTLALGAPIACNEEGSSNGAKQRLAGNDPKGDWVCDETPDAKGPDALDIRSMDVRQVGDDIEVTLTFEGDIEAYDQMTTSKLPVGVAFRFGDEYVEVLFDTKTKVKVVDGKAEAMFELDGNRLIITVKNRKVADITTVTGSTTAGGFDNGFDGVCNDDKELDCEDEYDGESNLPNNDNENNEAPDMDVPPDGDPSVGGAYVMLTDRSPITSGDFGGSDVDRIEICKQSTSSNCSTFNVLVENTPDVINPSGVTTDGADACMNESFASLGGDGEYVILTLADTSISLEQGDNIRAFGLSEILCAEAGPDAEQTYEVSISRTQDVGSFELLGTCGAQVPCRHPVPATF